MTVKRIIATLAITAGVLGGTASAANAKPPKCPPGQTAVVEVVGIEVVTTCRVL